MASPAGDGSWSGRSPCSCDCGGAHCVSRWPPLIWPTSPSGTNRWPSFSGTTGFSSPPRSSVASGRAGRPTRWSARARMARGSTPSSPWSACARCAAPITASVGKPCSRSSRSSAAVTISASRRTVRAAPAMSSRPAHWSSPGAPARRRLKSWDGFYVPRPFSRVQIRCAVVPAAELRDEGMTAEVIQQRLRELNPD